MTRDEMRRKLVRWGHTIYFVGYKEREIAGLRQLMDSAYCSLPNAALSGMPKGGTGELTAVERSAELASIREGEYERREKDASDEIALAFASKKEMDTVIDALPPLKQKILHMRYEDDRRWGFISAKLRYDYHHVLKLERQAVDELRKKTRADVGAVWLSQKLDTFCHIFYGTM
jgi:DNA-directed RNA polymerase specialized sigma24 family protein